MSNSVFNRNILAFIFLFIIDLKVWPEPEYHSAAKAAQSTQKQALTAINWETLYLETKNDPKEVIKVLDRYISKNSAEISSHDYLRAMEIYCMAYSTLEDVVHLKKYATEGLEFSKEHSQEIYEAIFTAYAALVFAGEKDFQKAEDYAVRSISLAEKTNDARAIGNSNTIYGQILLEKGNYQESLTFFTKGYEIALDRKDELSVISNLSKISVVYSQLGQRQLSLTYLEKVLALLEPDKSAMDLSITYYNLGVGYRREFCCK